MLIIAMAVYKLLINFNIYNMKKIIFISAIALLILATVGCDKKDKDQKEYDETLCPKLYYERIADEGITIDGVIKYSEKHKQYGIYTEKDPHWWSSEIILFCPLLESQYCEEGLHINVSGILYDGIVEQDLSPAPSEDDSLPPGGVETPTILFRDYTIN
ncbi:MAG: hypothetical protein CSB06_02330 [Bacteroidia bacterium]|nr:MAG: hypothetical protein CSB06_02330 [Bacteroidia bacterium]